MKGDNIMKMSNVETFHRYKVEIETLAEVREFVNIATTCKGKLFLESGENFKINAKSLLGVIIAKKLNWSDITLVAEEECYAKFAHFIVE